MKYGFVLPKGDARIAADFSAEAEAAGWDGFFVAEPVWGVDAWISLTAAAMVTKNIRLGTMLSPISRMRPWKLASETATLDNLSGGRVILAAGLGAIDTGFAEFDEVTDRKTRAELMDEGLEILTGLWKGQPFQFEGKHYHIQPTQFFPPPPPIQQPRILIWMVGAWPSPKSMQRALRYDGILPAMLGEDGKVEMRAATLDEVRQIKKYIETHRSETTLFDIIVEGETPGNDRAKAAVLPSSYADSGATWWLESRWTAPDLDVVLQRIRQGPPKTL